MISVLALMAFMTIAILPAVNAIYIDTSPRKTTAYITVAPIVIGKGQQLTVNCWVWPAPSGPSYYAQTLNVIYYENYTVTFTRPDGSKDTFMPENPSITEKEGSPKPGKTEAVGTTYFFYTPTQVGTYSVSFSFPGKTFYMLNDPSVGVFYEAATSQTIQFTVKEDPVNAGLINGWPWSPLPTGYWQEPINAQNREWSTLGGDWIVSNIDMNFNPYATGPKSPHIAWTNEVSQGGIIGGEWGSISYGAGGGSPPLVMDGKVYYNMPGNVFRCVDLQTGQLLWTASGQVSLALRTRPESVNVNTPQVNEAVVSCSLWGFSGTNWYRYDPVNGALLQTITGAPSVVRDREFMDGSTVVYISQADGWNTTRLNGYAWSNLIKWDYAKVTGNNWNTGVVWNVSTIRPDGTSVGDGRRSQFALYRFDYLGVILVKAHNDEGHFMVFDATTGAYLYTKIHGIVDKSTINFGPGGPLAIWDSVTRTYHAFDPKTGNKLWQSDVIGKYGWGAAPSGTAQDWDTLYVAPYDGYVYAIDKTTGKLKWKSDWTGELSSEVIFGATPAGSLAVADGIIYSSFLYTWEFQPRSRFRTVNAFDVATGKLLWNVSGSTRPSAVAGGFLLGTNAYDGYLYAFGKGKSATTVSASPKVATNGSIALIEGTVLDLSPAQPNTPAVAKESMGAWMNYLHAQQPMPTDTKGVPVQLMAIDPNGNIIVIGTATSDAMGHFEFAWTPTITGTYKVLASFAGDDSYWSSSAETALAVTAATASASAGEQVVNGGTDNTLLFTAVIVGVIVAIAIGLVNLLVARKRQ